MNQISRCKEGCEFKQWLGLIRVVIYNKKVLDKNETARKNDQEKAKMKAKTTAKMSVRKTNFKENSPEKMERNEINF